MNETIRTHTLSDEPAPPAASRSERQPRETPRPRLRLEALDERLAPSGIIINGVMR
jgi:hypothetical protein